MRGRYRARRPERSGSARNGGGRARLRLAEDADLCFTALVRVYGIASSVSRDVDDFYPTAAEAEATLAEIVADEPELEGMLWVEPVELELSSN